MRHISPQGYELIKLFEGFSPNIYLCPGGYKTIGYGHRVTKEEEINFASGINRETAGRLLQKDIEKAENAVLRLIKVPLTNGQFNALVSFTYNLGAGALQRSTLRRKVNREDHHAVPREFKRWVWANGRKLRGLVRRRKVEAVMYQGA